MTSEGWQDVTGCDRMWQDVTGCDQVTTMHRLARLGMEMTWKIWQTLELGISTFRLFDSSLASLLTESRYLRLSAVLASSPTQSKAAFKSQQNQGKLWNIKNIGQLFLLILDRSFFYLAPVFWPCTTILHLFSVCVWTLERVESCRMWSAKVAV